MIYRILLICVLMMVTGLTAFGQTCTDGQVPVWSSTLKWTCASPAAQPLPVGSAVNMTVANDTVTGTTVNRLAKLTGAPSKAIISATTDTENALGVVTAGAGIAGNATIAILGQVTCDFDGATIAGNYVVISSTTAGKCHDGGSAFPNALATYGRVLSTNGASGAFVMELMTPDIAFQNAGNGKSKPGGSDTQIQFNDAGTFGGDAGLTFDKTNNSVAITQGTLTTSQPFINHIATWNSLGVTFNGFTSNTTNTGSAIGSTFFDWQLNAVTQFRLRKDGTNSTAVDIGDHVLAPNGTAARPSYGFTNETNTGWYFTAGSCIIAAVNGVSNTCFGRNASSFSQSKPFGFAGATITNDSMQAGFGFVANGQLEVLGTSAATGGTLFSRAQASNSGASFAPNLAAGTVRVLTLNSATPTIGAATGQVAGIIYTLRIVQDATGGRVPTWDATYKFASGAAPTLTSTANAVDVLRFLSDGTNMYEVSRSLQSGNCSDSAGAAACGAAGAGSVVIDAGATTVVVSTTSVTANSQIFVQYDSSLGTRLSVTCNTTVALPAVTARTAATSFTISVPVAPTVNPACYSYFIVN